MFIGVWYRQNKHKVVFITVSKAVFGIFKKGAKGSAGRSMREVIAISQSKKKNFSVKEISFSGTLGRESS